MVGRCVCKGIGRLGGDRLRPDVKGMPCSEKYSGLYSVGWVEKLIPKDGGGGSQRRSNNSSNLCFGEMPL